MTTIEIIGRTNGGKSSLFNALILRNMAITCDEEHTTRDYVRFWGEHFVITDNVGMGKGEKLNERILNGDILLYVIPYGEMNDVDKFYFQQLKKANKSFFLVITKCDNQQSDFHIWKTTYATNVFYTSTKNNFGLKELRTFLQMDDTPQIKKTIAIVGGVNSGKSSLLNLLAGYNRNLVSNVAATTRDAVMEPIGDYYFIDTAGFNAIDKRVEKIALSRSLEVLKHANVAIIVVDASISFSKWNKWLWLQCEKYNKGMILLFNKSDILKQEGISKRYLLEEWSIKEYIPHMFFSTKSRGQVSQLMETIKQVIKSTEKKIGKAQLARFISTIQLPTNNNRINLVQKIPQEFILYCKKEVNQNYKNYLENQLISYFRLVGIRPIIRYEKMKYMV